MVEYSVTALLGRVSKDSHAWEAIYSLTYAQLRRIASGLLRRERPGHTLQATALVNESFLKISRMNAALDGEAHFYNLSARAMRQVLIDHARARKDVKRVDAETIAVMLADTRDSSFPTELRLALKEAMARLREMDSLAADTVWSRYAEGATIEELAREQSREQWRVRGDCDFATTWLASRLSR
jgi:RNA polymerase sigma-70 factor, ECF subfamily